MLLLLLLLLYTWLLVVAMQVICEFLEHAAPAANSSSSSRSAAIDPLLSVGAVRVLGRFLADVPEAHQEVLQKLLPQLLALNVSGSHQEQGVRAGSAVCFLLPALLCWTAPSSSSQQQWAAVLLAPGNGCLQRLASFAGDAAAAAAGLAGKLAASGELALGSGSGSSSSGGALDEMRSVESQLGTACQVLQQLLASLPAARSRQQQQQQQQNMPPVSLQEEHYQELTPLLQQLGSWGLVRCQQQQQEQEQQTDRKARSLGPAPVSAAAEFLQSQLAVCLELPVVLPAAALAGQLLALLTASSAGTHSNRNGAQLVAWGCESGWSYQLCNAWQQQQQRQQQGAAGAARMDYSRALDWLLLQLQDAWLSAELSEVWDYCLSQAAELLVEGRCGSMLQVLAGAAWMKEAAQAMAAADANASGGHPQLGELDEASQLVLEGTMALQLLARALPRA
jgi:hypothetical protein